MSRPSFVVPVEFEGDGEGTYPLSWTQAGHLAAMLRLRDWHPLGGIKPLEPGTTVDDIAEELRYLVSRFQSMRTRLRFAPGADKERIVPGTDVEQIVHGRGVIGLEVVDPGTDDPAEVAEEVRARYADTPLDFETEWPLRMAVIARDGLAGHMVVLASHIATDGFGAMVMIEEVAARTDTPVDGQQPAAQALWQRSPAGQRHNQTAMRYWERTLRAIGARRFRERDDLPTDGGGRYREGQLTSAAVSAALATLAARSAVNPSHLLTAAHAIALRRVTGINPVVVRPLVSNRFRPGLARVVCTLVTAGLYAIDADTDSFDEMVLRAQRATMAAYKHAYCDSDELGRVVNRVEADRGEHIDLSSFINNRRNVTVAAVTPAGILADLAATSTFEWTTIRDTPSYESLFVHFDDASIIVQLDTHAISPADAEAVARGIESVLVEAATTSKTAPSLADA